MDEKLLIKLLRERTEKDWFDFKRKLEIYQADGSKPVDKQRDELLKDILGLANGNSHIIRKTKYLIIGADDEKFDEEGMRVLHNVDYKTPSNSDITKWIVSACGSAIVGLESETVAFQGMNLFVITIPPTFKLHETIRKLDASKSFQQHTVFMRQDENTVPASVQDIQDIQYLKQLHRQEVKNPSANWVGAIAGGVVAFIIGGAKVREAQLPPIFTERVIQWFFTGLGVFFGGSIGYFSREWNETRYAWRYMTWRARFLLIVLILVMIGVIYLINR